MVILNYVIPQLIFAIEVLFTLETKPVVQAQLIVRMNATLGVEDLDVARRQISLDKIDSEEY